MIDICLMGGLGNQMFQYALYKCFEIQGKPSNMFFLESSEDICAPTIKKVFPYVHLKLDNNLKEYNRIVKEMNPSFTSKAARRLLYTKRPLIYEKKNGKYDRRVLKLQEAALIGYWQTSKYWTNIQNELKRDFSFSVEYNDEFLDLFELIENNETVSIHVRGGDYYTPANEMIYGGICTTKYYEDAIAYIEERKKGKKLLYLVFSNDYNIVDSIIRKGEMINIVDYKKKQYPDWIDMMLMSRCKHNIIANSSFSWWAAYLNSNTEKIVVSPSRWINGERTKDIWEKSWIRI